MQPYCGFVKNTMAQEKKYDVFISSKSEDYPIAEKVYDFLVANGLTVFLASTELRRIGEAEYSEAVDAAIDGSHHMVVVTTSLEYLNSKWVRYEWTTFANDLRSNYKEGNLLTILGPKIQLKDLPTALRHKQSFSIKSYKENILDYLYKDKRFDNLEAHLRTYSKPTPRPQSKQWIWIACAVVAIVIGAVAMFVKNRNTQPSIESTIAVETQRQDSIARALQAEADRLAQERARLDEQAQKAEEQRKAEAAKPKATATTAPKATTTTTSTTTTTKVETPAKVDPLAAAQAKAAAGDAAACYQVALAYKNGEGVAKNLSTAFQYMKSAAEKGYTSAYIEVAKMYHGGRGVTKDRDVAEQWYQKAADAGNAEARRILLNM